MKYHVLNGDVLDYQLPESINGSRIIARECLIDGNVKGDSLEDFFKNRKEYLTKTYPEIDEDYYSYVAQEFYKIVEIEEGAEINLWFEDDLFCQTNFWFICHLLRHKTITNSIYLVRPFSGLQKGFADMSSTEFTGSLNRRREISRNILHFSLLWKAYQSEDFETMKEIAYVLKTNFPFVEKAVQAHLDRYPLNGDLPRPVQTMLNIQKELKTNDFSALMKEFTKRESIYGFGDLQLKRMFLALNR